MTKLQLKEIKTSDLVVDKFNVRGDDWDNDEELVNSIKSQGVLEPLLVRPIKDKKLYPPRKSFSIICGNRRWHGAMEGRLKTVPCVIRNDLDDFTAFGTSLQENLQRHSLGKMQEAEAIAKMWEMLNGERTYDDKIKEMNKTFGLKERRVYNYLAVSRLATTLKGNLQKTAGKLDIDTLAGISSEEEWNEKEKFEAIETLSEIESGRERKSLLSELKSRAKEESPREALESIKKEMKGLQGINLDVWLNFKEREATVKACKKLGIEMETLVKRNHVNWLKKESYLK